MSIWFEESIPVEKSQFTKVLRDNLPESDWETFDHFAKLFEHYCNYKFRNILNQLHGYYQPFNPNTSAPIPLTESEEQYYVHNLINRFKRFLEQAQYQQMNEYDIRDILRQSQIHGMEIGFPSEKYQEFLVYYREPVLGTKYVRSWRTLWLHKYRREIWYYKRITILVHPFRKSSLKFFRNIENIGDELRSVHLPQPILLKLFQDIRQDYLPIIFPGIFLKFSFLKKIYLAMVFSGAIALSLVLFFLGASSWYGALGLLPLLFFFYTFYESDKIKKQYYRDLLNHFYHKNVGNNSGVLSYLNDRIAEETYKQNFLVLYAFWKKASWSFHPISMQSVTAYIQNFILEYFGIQVKLNLENVLPDLLAGFQNTEPSLPPMLHSCFPMRGYIKYHVNPGSKECDLEETSIPLLQSGMVHIAPGTEYAEKKAFYSEKFLLHIQDEQGLKFSHEPGSAVRWIMDKPLRTKLLEDISSESDFLSVSQESLDRLPLQGIGKVILGERQLEFRYHRKREENRLSLDAGLRYRHSVCHESQVLVRPRLPFFSLAQECVQGTDCIEIPENIVFPETGLVKFCDSDRFWIVPYRIENKEGKDFLSLTQKTKEPFSEKTNIFLTPPVAKLKYTVKKNTWLLPLQDNEYFSKRGTLILSPDTEQEERIFFQGETLRIRLSSPLLFTHRRGTLVSIKGMTLKSKLTHKAYRRSEFITIQGFPEDIVSGEIMLDPGEEIQEIHSFSIAEKYFELTTPTRFRHPEGSQVWEAKLESPLRYEALQGSHLITVEDASSFPLAGTLEINFHSMGGVKEVFPFMRTQCSNTLILKSQAKEILKKDSPVIITAVEVATDCAFYYHDKRIKADFSCVPSFPNEGTIILEPGSQREETIVFQRHPNRIYFHKPIEYFHSAGTVMDFSNYMQCETKEEIQINQDKVYIDIQPLLPERGVLFFHDKGQKDCMWYRKLPGRIMLHEPCHYHHSKGSEIVFPSISKNVTLAMEIEKGDQRIKINNAQELPKKGKIKIEGILFHEILVEYTREEDMLYLKEPIPHNFSIHATISIPEVYLNTHLSPGMEYLEISDASFLPESGELCLEASSRYEEKITYQYLPAILWMDKAFPKGYEPGTIVQSPELEAKGTGSMDSISLEESVEQLKKSIESLYQQKDEKKAKVLMDMSITQQFLKF